MPLIEAQLEKCQRGKHHWGVYVNPETAMAMIACHYCILCQPLPNLEDFI